MWLKKQNNMKLDKSYSRNSFFCVPGSSSVIRFLLLAISVAVLVACQSGFYQHDILREEEYSVVYRLPSAVYPEDRIREQMKRQVEIPVLTEEQLIRVLGALRFERKYVWSVTERNIYYETEVRRLAPLVVESLNFLDDEHRLLLLSRYDPDRSVLSRMERTTAMIWAEEDGLNIIFGEIRQEIPQNEFLSREDWKDVLPISFRQAYSDLKVLPADPALYSYKNIDGFTHRTWIVIPFDNIDQFRLPSEEAAEAEAEQRERSEQESLADRLRQLKEAKEEGLITEEEYNERREAVLDSL